MQSSRALHLARRISSTYDLLALTGKHNRIACYWEKGHVNEIDLVAVNDLEKTLLLAEVKMNKRKNSATRLEHRAINLVSRYADYTVEYKRINSLTIVACQTKLPP